MYKTIFLKRGKEASVRRYHPWIFSGAIARMDSDVAEGEVVRVMDAEGNFLAVGHYQIGSIISCHKVQETLSLQVSALGVLHLRIDKDLAIVLKVIRYDYIGGHPAVY